MVILQSGRYGSEKSVMRIDSTRTLLVVSKLVTPLLIALGIGATFLREVLIAYYHASAQHVEYFRLAFAMPMALFQTLGSTLVGGLLPLCVRHGPTAIRQIRKSIGAYFNILLICVLVTLPLQVMLIAPGYGDAPRLSLGINMLICWLALPLLTIIHTSRLALQTENRLNLISATSLLFSLFFAGFLFSFEALTLPFTRDYSLSITALLALVAVATIYKTTAGRITECRDEDRQSIDRRAVYYVLTSAIVYTLLLTLPRVVDRAYASWFESGLIANIDYAMNFYVAFGVLVGTSYTIVFARKIAEIRVSNTLSGSKYLALIIPPLVLSAAVVIVLSFFTEQLVELAYYRNEFKKEDVLQIAHILNAYWWALPFMVAGMVASQVVMAYRASYLVAIMIVKIIVKILFMLSLTTDLSSLFGYSALAMELAGLALMSTVVYRRFAVAGFPHGKEE